MVTTPRSVPDAAFLTIELAAECQDGALFEGGM